MTEDTVGFSLRDITFEGGTGFPIFRDESIDFMRQYEPIKLDQHREPEEPEQTPEPSSVPAEQRHNFKITDDNGNSDRLERVTSDDGRSTTLTHYVGDHIESVEFHGIMPGETLARSWHFTHEEHTAMENTNLVAYINHNGYELEPHGDTGTLHIAGRPDIVINPDTNTWHFAKEGADGTEIIWGGGNAWDFACDLQRKSPTEAVEALMAVSERQKAADLTQTHGNAPEIANHFARSGQVPEKASHTGISDSLYVFENPTDMLSFLTLNKDKDWQRHSYVSGAEACDDLLTRNPDIKRVALCFSNSAAGQEAVGKLSEDLMQRGYEVTKLPPKTGKSWSEQLQSQLHAQSPADGVFQSAGRR